jgi:hypothetical protein
MKRSDAIPYVSFVVDDTGNGRKLGDDQHAIIRPGGRWIDDGIPSSLRTAPKYPSVLVGWQCGFEPLFVAVHSDYDVRLDDDEAEEMARDYLIERGWFSDNTVHEITGDNSADYIIR